jgi:hypothetical protein
MTYKVNLCVLVNDAEEVCVLDGINAMLRAAQQPVEGGCAPWIVDWQISSVDPVSTALDDLIASETYMEGDAFRRSEILAKIAAARGWSVVDVPMPDVPADELLGLPPVKE